MQTRAIPPVAPAEPGEVDRSLRDTLGRHLGVAAEPLALRVTVPSALALQILVAEFRRGEKSLLWEQDEQILDSPLSGGDGGFWVRDSERLAFVCVGVW